MGLIYKLIGKNIFIDPRPVPNKSPKVYAIYVYKDRLKEIKAKFKKINEKVSDESAYKELSDILMDKKNSNWNKDKPKSWNNYPDKNDKKYFCELSIDKIANLKNIIDAYKSKLFQGWKLVFDGESKEEIKNFSDVKKLIRKESVSSFAKKIFDKIEIKKNKLKNKDLNKSINKSEGTVSGEGQKTISDKLSDVELSKNAEYQLNQAKKKYKELLDKNLEEFDKKINAQTKEVIQKAGLSYTGDLIYDSKKGNGGTIIDKFYEFKKEVKKGSEEENLLDNWIDNVGTNLGSRDKSLGTLKTYIEEHGYNIIGILGSGGAAMVVKIINKKGKERALKIFNNKDELSDYQDEKSAIERMKSLDKNKVKKYFNAPKLDEKGNMEMKLAKKVLDSDEFINRGDNDSNLKASFFRRMARQVLKGLETLHSEGLIYGDIKPDNIHMVANKKAGKADRFKIADLGTVSSAGKKVRGGTPTYVHPYYNDNGKDVSSERQKKNDVYALGCSLLEILMGKKIVTGRSSGHINYLKANDDDKILGEIKSKYKKMDEKSLKAVLEFIRKLCQEDLNKVPMAKEALKDDFFKKTKSK